MPAIVIPILVLAGLCVLFGVYNKLPLTNFIQPILEGHAADLLHNPEVKRAYLGKAGQKL